MPIPPDHLAGHVAGHVARHGPVVRLADPVADAVAGAHDDAALLLVPDLRGQPPVDAGDATAAVEGLLSSLVTTCADLRDVNRMLADGVRDAARGLGAADDRVAETFSHAAAGVAS